MAFLELCWRHNATQLWAMAWNFGTSKPLRKYLGGTQIGQGCPKSLPMDQNGPSSPLTRSAEARMFTKHSPSETIREHPFSPNSSRNLSQRMFMLATAFPYHLARHKISWKYSLPQWTTRNRTWSINLGRLMRKINSPTTKATNAHLTRRSTAASMQKNTNTNNGPHIPPNGMGWIPTVFLRGHRDISRRDRWINWDTG